MIATISKRLTEDALGFVRNSKKTKSKLQLQLNKSPATIARYLKINAIELTSAEALDIISEETGISKDDLLGAEPSS